MAGTPLKSTDVAPVKKLPLMVTKAPAAPVGGVKPLMEVAISVKLVELVAQPPAVSTRITPVPAPAGATAVI